MLRIQINVYDTQSIYRKKKKKIAKYTVIHLSDIEKSKVQRLQLAIGLNAFLRFPITYCLENVCLVNQFLWMKSGILFEICIYIMTKTPLNSDRGTQAAPFDVFSHLFSSNRRYPIDLV